jgi:hypothetical protein
MLSPVGQLHRLTCLKRDGAPKKLPREMSKHARYLTASVRTFGIEVLPLITMAQRDLAERTEFADAQCRSRCPKVELGNTWKDESVRMQAMRLVCPHSRLNTRSDAAVLRDGARRVMRLKPGPYLLRETGELSSVCRREVEHAWYVLTGSENGVALDNRPNRDHGEEMLALRVYEGPRW